MIPKAKRFLSAEIKPQLDKCTFLLLKQKGDELFANSDWTGAFSHFQDAMALGTNLEQSEVQVLSSLQGDIIRAELYATINEGKTAFANAQWDEAIKKYAKASKILMDNQGLLNPTDLDQNREKLTRIMLQASIIRDRQEADRFVEEKIGKMLKEICSSLSRQSTKAQLVKKRNFRRSSQNRGKKLQHSKRKNT